ncbi:hypothetical protein [Pararhodobacter zhoushanensis]|uniref:Uncharacterized protein n=1 Tax=Pararhodobacter zhoushanensis TaxID=2479545 RepID=A0ABT3H426_9RHOB|nr:hypothetical protein [Pararhodobacter zhoushanensis]MCW1934531.1 hypothetical protein [Pararhodobacter zhoushanensis]
MTQVPSLSVENDLAQQVRQNINALVGAVNSHHSGASAPTAFVPWQFWADTSSGALKIRNPANTAWVHPLSLFGAATTALAMGGNKVTGLAAGTDPADAVTLAQLEGYLTLTSASQAVWNAGVSTTETVISPAKLAALLSARKWYDVTASRTGVTVYTNDTPLPLHVSITADAGEWACISKCRTTAVRPG